MTKIHQRVAVAFDRYGFFGTLIVALVRFGRAFFARSRWFATRLLYVRHLAWTASIQKGVNFSSPQGRIRIGPRSYVGLGCRFICSPEAEVTIGSGTTLIHCAVIGASSGGVIVGNNVMIGEFVSIRDSQHSFENSEIPISKQGERCAPVAIDDDVWIGRGSIIMAGVNIGRGAVIGANSVVRHDVAPYTVVAGAPARVVKRRDTSGSPALMQEKLAIDPGKNRWGG